MDDISKYYISPFEVENDMLEQDIQQELEKNIKLRSDLELEIQDVLQGEFLKKIKKQISIVLPPDKSYYSDDDLLEGAELEYGERERIRL